MNHCDNCTRPWCYGCPYLEEDEEEEGKKKNKKNCSKQLLYIINCVII